MTTPAVSDRRLRDLIIPGLDAILAGAGYREDEGDDEIERFLADLFKAGPWADWESQVATINTHIEALNQRLTTSKTGGTPCRD